jgi:phosphatidylglycerol:prolipoprotein diacylglycerol transferase
MFLSTFHPQPILLHLGSITIHWYGFLLAISAVAGFLLLLRTAKPYSIDTNTLYDLFVLLVLSGFIGGRLYHVTNEWTYYRSHLVDIVKVWNGGLAIHGAVIAGIIVTWFVARAKKLSFGLLLDLLVPSLALGQAIGRWGNYFNQELFGGPTNLPWKIVIDSINRPSGYISNLYFHPTFLYESIGSLIIFAVLLVVLRARQQRTTWAKFFTSNGTLFSLYLVLSGALRIGVEALRIDRVPILGGVRLPLIVGGLMIVIGIVLLIRLRSHGKR